MRLVNELLHVLPLRLPNTSAWWTGTGDAAKYPGTDCHHFHILFTCSDSPPIIRLTLTLHQSVINTITRITTAPKLRAASPRGTTRSTLDHPTSKPVLVQLSNKQRQCNLRLGETAAARERSSRMLLTEGPSGLHEDRFP